MEFPYDAIMVCSYGGPYQATDVLPFMRNATKGRGIPDERLLEVSGHYQLFGGCSPINARNEELLVALRAELQGRGITVPVVIGNRNWHPFFTETLTDLKQRGCSRILTLFTAAFDSYSSSRQYCEDMAAAIAELGWNDVVIDRVAPYFTTDGFRLANVDAICAALDELEAQGITSAHIVLVTHSIPTPMEFASGSAAERATSAALVENGLDAASARAIVGASYAAQHHWLAARIMEELQQRRGQDYEWGVAYCSRSGPPQSPWLEPDINDYLEAMEGISGVVVSPFGFINDHMEVVYDLDTEARATAEKLNMPYVRAATVGTHSAFITSLAEAIESRAAGAVRDARPDLPWYAFMPADGSQYMPGATGRPTIVSA